MNLPTETSTDALARLEVLLAHAWMVRTFIKHSDEVESFPELMQVVRSIFDTVRAVESRRGDLAGMLAMLRKKFARLKAAADQFRVDAPRASDHENFRQAVKSLDGCLAEIAALLGETRV